MENVFALVAERVIQEAIDEGKFDNLPGKGKPLVLDDDPSTPAHLRTVNRILKNAGVLPDWMQLEREIDRTRDEIAKMRERLDAEYPKRRARADVAPPRGVDPMRPKREFADWLARQRRAYLAAVKQVNHDITKLSLMAPSVQRVHIPFRMNVEMERFDAAFPALPGVQAAPEPSASQREGVLRLSATARYRGDALQRSDSKPR